MDTRLTFRDYIRSIKTDAGTQRVNPSAQWFQRGVKRGREGEIRPAVCQENPLRRVECIRTTNRHRWTRRKFSGARVMDCSGTRQISSVTSGEGVPWQQGRSEARQ